MQNNLYYSPEARSDLDEIWNYIAVELSNSRAAANTVNGILNALNNIKTFPASGSPLSFNSGFRTNYRFIIFKNYIAFYQIAKNNIYVHRILYNKRDYMKILFKQSNTVYINNSALVLKPSLLGRVSRSVTGGLTSFYLPDYVV